MSLILDEANYDVYNSSGNHALRHHATVAARVFYAVKE